MKQAFNGECLDRTMNEEEFLNGVLTIFINLVNNGDVKEICGDAQGKRSCNDICLDLNFNIVSC